MTVLLGADVPWVARPLRAALIEPVEAHLSWRPQLLGPDDDMVLEAARNVGVVGRLLPSFGAGPVEPPQKISSASWRKCQMRPLIRRTRYRPIWLSDCGICDKAALEAKHRKAAFDFARVFKPDPLPPGRRHTLVIPSAPV